MTIAKYEDAHLAAVKIPFHSASFAVVQKYSLTTKYFLVLSLKAYPLQVGFSGEVMTVSTLSLMLAGGGRFQWFLCSCMELFRIIKQTADEPYLD